MIISHSKKFIHIKNEKVAGTSIETFLSCFCNNNDILTKLIGKDRNGKKDEKIRYELTGISGTKYKDFKHHEFAINIKNKVSKNVWDNYYRFAFIRNPYDKMVSFYFFLKDTRPKKYKNFSFEEFIVNREKIGKPFDSNYQRITNNGKIIIDEVFYYEKINEELHKIQKKLNLNNGIELPFRKSHYRKNKNYKKLYNNKTREIVGRKAKEEIELFGYEF